MQSEKDGNHNDSVKVEVLPSRKNDKKKSASHTSPNAIVAKSNELIQKTRYSLPKVQQKVLFAIISKIDSKNDTDPSKVYSLSFQEFSKLTGVDATNQTYVNYLKETIKDLADASFWIKNRGENKETLMRWIGDGTTVDYEKKEIRIRFSDSIFPHLTQLKTSFTRIEVRYVLRMNSTYSMRIYELLCSYDNGDKEYESAFGTAFMTPGSEILAKFYESTGKDMTGYKFKTFDIEDLKEQLSPAVDNAKKTSKKTRPLREKYKNFANFEANVLRIARDEINELTDLWVDYVPSKSKGSRKFDLLYFFIKFKTDEEMARVEQIYANAQAQQDTPRKANNKAPASRKDSEPAVTANTPLREELFTLSVSRAVRALSVRAEMDALKKEIAESGKNAADQMALRKSADDVLKYLAKIITNTHDEAKSKRAHDTVDGINMMLEQEGSMKLWTLGMAQTLLVMESENKLKTPQYNAAVVANAVGEQHIIQIGKQVLKMKKNLFQQDWNQAFD